MRRQLSLNLERKWNKLIKRKKNFPSANDGIKPLHLALAHGKNRSTFFAIMLSRANSE